MSQGSTNRNATELAQGVHLSLPRTPLRGAADLTRGNVMSILVWIVLGLIAGWLASLVMKGGYGIIGDIVLGIVGALVGGFFSSYLLGRDITGINLESILIATVGAIIVIAIARAVSGRRAAL